MVSGAAAWAEGTHEAGPETISYDLGWFWPVEYEDIWVEGIFLMWYGGRGKQTRTAEDRSVRRLQFPQMRNTS